MISRITEITLASIAPPDETMLAMTTGDSPMSETCTAKVHDGRRDQLQDGHQAGRQ